MELKTYVAQDATGEIIPGATASLYLVGSNELATGITDANGIAMANPMTTDANGVITFMAPSGRYELQFSLGPLLGPRFYIQLLDVTATLEAANQALDVAKQTNADSRAVLSLRIYPTTAMAQADGNLAINNYYAIPANEGVGAFTYYRKLSSTTSTLISTIASASQVTAMNQALSDRLTIAAFTQVVQRATESETDLMYCVRDSNHYQTWLGVRKLDGGPSAHAERMLRDMFGIRVRENFLAAGEQICWAVTDSEGNLTDLAIRALDGQLADYAVRRISGRMLEGVNQSIANQLNPLRVPRDATGYQVLASMCRWAAVRGRGGNVTGPIDFVTAQNRQNARLSFPSPYAKDDPMLLVMYFGGVGSGPTLTPPPEYAALNNDGIIWARCNYEGDHYGSPKAMQDVFDVYEQACKLAPVGGVLLLGNSMGGMGALNALLTGVVPGVLGLYLTDPVANLWDRYNSTRQDLIKAAYGIASNGVDYSVKTAGYDPMLRHWSDFRGVPVYCIASSGDTLVPMNTNGQMLYDMFSQHLDFEIVDKGTAGHNTSDRFDPNALRAFIRKCVTGSILK